MILCTINHYAMKS